MKKVLLIGGLGFCLLLLVVLAINSNLLLQSISQVANKSGSSSQELEDGSNTATSTGFSSQEMARTIVSDLGFDSVMNKLYAGQLFELKMNENPVDDESLKDLPYIGVQQLIDDQKRRFVTFMRPAIGYLNHDNQQRYLIIVEKHSIDEDDYLDNACHGCSAELDMFIFKKLSNNQYQLVSRNKKHIQLGGVWGSLFLTPSEMLEGLQPLGKNLVGSITESAFSTNGWYESSWMALFLPEDDYITSATVADAATNNGGQYDEDSPLSYGYESTFRVIDDGSKYYPIAIHYTGEKPDENDHIKKVNYTQVVHYDPSSGEYR